MQIITIMVLIIFSKFNIIIINLINFNHFSDNKNIINNIYYQTQKIVMKIIIIFMTKNFILYINIKKKLIISNKYF